MSRARQLIGTPQHLLVLSTASGKGLLDAQKSEMYSSKRIISFSLNMVVDIFSETASFSQIKSKGPSLSRTELKLQGTD